ncbi:MgtC/SapB family protein [Paraclostridium bifermentans]|uniref:MgtC/SapB family protein n=1 Tax=Paraclostridium bifermentans TaxID=1490 RepID=UPI00359C7FCA
MSLQDIIIRILLSILIGGTIGYNRERENVSAGFRTHALVCLGATIAGLIQVELGQLAISEITKTPELASAIKINDGRFIGQVISGIGFLGAGTIIKTKGSVRGLTTAASIWSVACIGIAIGVGFYRISIIGGLSIITVLVVLKKIEEKFIIKASNMKLKIKYKDKSEAIKEIKESIDESQVKIENIEVLNENECIYTLSKSKLIGVNEVVSTFIENDSVVSVSQI